MVRQREESVRTSRRSEEPARRRSDEVDATRYSRCAVRHVSDIGVMLIGVACRRDNALMSAIAGARRRRRAARVTAIRIYASRRLCAARFTSWCYVLR